MNNNFPGVTLSQTFRQIKRSRKGLISIVIAIVVILGIIVLVNTTVGKSNAQSSNTAVKKNQEVQPIADQIINRVFQFSVKDKTGKVITNFDYKIIDAQLINEVIINGQKYNPIAGKVFLVINLEITNNFTQTITIQPRDYVPILMNHSSEKLAPDIYNDPVDVQAISTKPSKLALAINTTDKNILMQVGEITGTKTIIPLTLIYK